MHFVECGLHSLTLGPLHTRAKSRDHEILRAQKKVSKGHPRHLPNQVVVWSRIMQSYVTGPQQNVISMNFIHAGPQP